MSKTLQSFPIAMEDTMIYDPEVKKFKGTYAEIDYIGSSIRSYFNEKIVNRISIRSFLNDVVEALGGKIEVLKEPKHYEMEGGSLTMFPDKSFIIKLSPITSERRDNFTIAHELGHFLLHYPSKKIERSIILPRYGQSELEQQANRFAAGFLMPKDEFLRKKEEFKCDTELLAEYFDVSSEAAKIRKSYLLE